MNRWSGNVVASSTPSLCTFIHHCAHACTLYIIGNPALKCAYICSCVGYWTYYCNINTHTHTHIHPPPPRIWGERGCSVTAPHGSWAVLTLPKLESCPFSCARKCRSWFEFALYVIQQLTECYSYSCYILCTLFFHLHTSLAHECTHTIFFSPLYDCDICTVSLKVSQEFWGCN